jgi:hypothetical protein
MNVPSKRSDWVEIERLGSEEGVSLRVTGCEEGLTNVYTMGSKIG